MYFDIIRNGGLNKTFAGGAQRVYNLGLKGLQMLYVRSHSFGSPRSAMMTLLPAGPAVYGRIIDAEDSDAKFCGWEWSTSATAGLNCWI